MTGLTPKQALVLKTITDYIDREGFPPSLADLMRLLGMGSVQSVISHLNPLESKGYISRKPGAYRAIKVLKTAEVNS